MGSIVDEVEPRIRELLRVYPTMPAPEIAQRIGWSGSIRVLSGRVAAMRPVYLPPDPAGRTSCVAGEIGQYDFWFPDVEVRLSWEMTSSGISFGHATAHSPVLCSRPGQAGGVVGDIAGITTDLARPATADEQHPEDGAGGGQHPGW